MSNPSYSQAQMIEALEKSAGIKSQAAKRLGCHRNTVVNYCKRYPKVQAAAQAQDDVLVDMAESVVVRKLQRDEWDAAKFVLTTKGKERGWGQSLGLDHAGEVILRVEYADDPDPPATPAHQAT